MLYGIVSLVACFGPMWGYMLNYFLCLAFIATVPCIIRKVVLLRV